MPGTANRKGDADRDFRRLDPSSLALADSAVSEIRKYRDGVVRLAADQAQTFN
jgi:hypothetical protein